jgi:hypothetical protein
MRSRFRVDQKVNTDPPPVPKDATQATADQRELQSSYNITARSRPPGLQQSRRNIADESTR